MAKHDILRKAKETKNDEFYIMFDDILSEIMQHEDYIKQFEGKTVLMNCDDPESSNFVVFFRQFFHRLKLKKMIATLSIDFILLKMESPCSCLTILLKRKMMIRSALSR